MSVAKIVKRFSLVTFPLLFFLTASVYGQSVTRGPYLQKVSDSSIHVLWSTDSLTDSYVFFGTVPASPTQVRFTSSDTNRHNVLIDSLIPNTTYYYAVGNQSGVFDSAVHFHFQTAPAIGSEEALRFWVTGDFGKGNTEQLDVLAAYNNYAGSNIANCWLWLGDNAYEDGTESDYQANVFDRYDSLMAYTPFFSTPGNHDYRSVSGAYVSHHSTHTGPYYDIVDVPISAELGGYPSSTEAYYSFNYGNAHFVSLNSEVQSTGSVNSDMEAWLHQDLSSDTSLWKIVFTHQPPYSKGSYDSDLSWELVIRGIRENYLPIFDQHDVRLALQQMDNGGAKLILPDINLKSFSCTPISGLNNIFLIADIAFGIKQGKDIPISAGRQAKQYEDNCEARAKSRFCFAYHATQMPSGYCRNIPS